MWRLVGCFEAVAASRVRVSAGVACVVVLSWVRGGGSFLFVGWLLFWNSDLSVAQVSPLWLLQAGCTILLQFRAFAFRFGAMGCLAGWGFASPRTSVSGSGGM